MSLTGPWRESHQAIGVASFRTGCSNCSQALVIVPIADELLQLSLFMMCRQVRHARSVASPQTTHSTMVSPLPGGSKSKKGHELAFPFVPTHLSLRSKCGNVTTFGSEITP